MDTVETRASAARAIAKVRATLRRELGDRPSGLADAFELAEQFLTSGTGLPALAARLLTTAESPLDARAYAIEEPHFPDVSFMGELWQLSGAKATRHADRRSQERLGFALDLPEIGEAVARRLEGGIAGARFALRYCLNPDYTNLGLHSNAHQPADEHEAEDWVTFFGFKGALHDVRHGLVPRLRKWAPGRASSNAYDHLIV